MKTTRLQMIVVAAILVATHSVTPRALAAAYVIGLSPNYTCQERTNVFEQVLLLILEGAQPADQLVFCDALHQSLVARCVIPEGKLFQANARARAQRLGSAMVALKSFLLADRTYPPEMASAVSPPQFLDFAATQLRRQGEPLRIILIGSALYMNADEPAYNMGDAYPSDANLLADQRESVFGTALKKRTMADVTVHYAYLRQCFLNDFHQERIMRFWSLFIRQQGGVLATFAPDINLAFQRAKENIQQPCLEAELDLNDTKIEMRQVVRRAIPVWFGPTNIVQKAVEAVNVPHVVQVEPQPETPSTPSPAPNAVAAPTNNTPAPALTIDVAPPVIFPISPTRDKVGIGITWGAPVDCDLYVKANPKARELFYRNTTSREGHYFHDYQNANLGVDYEYVELQPPVDLTQVSAWVNYYAGKTSSVRGLVVVFYEGKSFYGEFQLAASKGNAGGDSASRHKSKYWTRLDLVKLVRTGNQLRPPDAPR